MSTQHLFLMRPGQRGILALPWVKRDLLYAKETYYMQKRPGQRGILALPWVKRDLLYAKETYYMQKRG
jgi:hypothetical protein